MLKADVVEKTNLLDSLHAENQDLSAKVSRLSDKHNDMQEYMIQLESDHESVTTSVSQLKIQNAALVSKNKDAEEYITGLESQLVSRDAMEQLIKHLEEQVSNASSGATAVATNASLPASSSLSTIPLDKGVQRHNDTDHLHTAIINSSSRSSIEVTPPASPPPPPSQTTDSSVLCKIITQDDAQRYNELNTEYMEDIKSWEIASKMFEAQIEGLITKLKTHQDREESLIRELEEFKQQQKQHEVTPNDNTPMTSSLARSVAVDQENHESLEQVPPLYSAPELCHEAASTSRDFDEDPCHCKEVLDQARDILIKNHHLDDGKSPSLPIAESSSYISSSAQLLLSSIQCLVESHLQQQQDLETTRSAIALAQLAVLPSCTSSHAEVQTEYIGVTESGNQTLVSALSCQLSESSSQTGFGDHTGDADTQTSFVIHEEPERRDAEMQTSEHIIFELSTQTDSSTYSDGECQYESSRLDMIENGTQTAIVHCEESFCQYELDISFGMDESDTQTVRISYADGFTQSDIDSSPQESSSRDVDLDIQSGSSYVAALLVDSSCQYELLPSSPSAEVADVELQTLESSFLSNSSCHAQTEADQEKLVNTVDAECQYSTSDSFTLSSCGFLMDADIQTDMTVFTDSASQHETEAESVLISATSTSSDLRAVKESRSLSSTIDSKDAACQHESEFSNVNSIATDTNGLLLLSASEIQTISILGFNDSADAIVQTECFPVTSDTSTLTDYAVDEFKNVFPISRGLAPDGASISRESMSLMEQQASIKRLETELDELKRQVHDKSEIIRRISSTSTSFSASVDDNSNLIGVWKRLSDSEKIIKSQSETLDKMQTRIWEQETTISIYKENKTSQQTLQLEQLAIMEKENLRLSDLIAELVQSKSGASNLSSLSSSSKSSMRAKSVHSVESEVNVTTMMDLEVMEAMEQQRDLEVKNLQAKLDQARATIDEMKSEEAATRQRGLLDDCDRAHEEVEQLRQDVVDRFNEYKAKRAAKDLSIYEAFAKEKNHLEQLVEEKTGQLEETSEKLKQLELAKEQVTDLMRRLTRDLETKNVALTKFSADNKALLAQNMILKRDLEEERARPSSIAVRGEDCHDDEEKSSVFNPITPAAVPAPVLDRKFEMELEAKFLALEEVVETRVLNLEHDLAEAKKRIESLNARIFESGSVFQQERAGLESIIQELESQLSIKEAELEFFINAKETMLTHLEDERSHLLQENDLLRLSLQDQEQQPQQPQQLQLCTDPKFYNSRMKELPPLVVSHVQVQTNEKHGDVLLCDTSSQTELINSIDQQKRIDSQMDEIANLGYELTRSQTVIRDLKKSLKLLDTDVVIARRESQTPGGATVAHPPISLASSSGKSLVLSAQDYLSLLSDSDGEDGGSGGGGGILPPILLHEADIDGINATSDSSAVDSELRNAVPEILPSLMFPETATVVSRSTVRNSLMEYRSQIREQEEEVERSRRKTLDLQSRLTNLTYENHHLHFRYENVRRELELRKKETSTTRSAWRRISNLFKLSKLTGRRRADSLDF